jgi:hypothetical protein
VPISICEQRDPKGLYKKAREGKIKGFTGERNVWRLHRHNACTSVQCCSLLLWFGQGAKGPPGNHLAMHSVTCMQVAETFSPATAAVAAGIDDPYEEPEAAELVLEAVDKDGQMVAPQVSAAKILDYLRAKRII